MIIVCKYILTKRIAKIQTCKNLFGYFFMFAHFHSRLMILVSLAIPATAGLIFIPKVQADESQVATSSSPRFDIQHFSVEGNTLLSGSEIDLMLLPFTGKSRDFSDVQHALETLESAYRRHGYGSVQVTLPEQSIESGSIKLVVTERKVRSIKVAGNQHFSDKNLLASVPGLKVGATAETRSISRSLKVANENPAKQVAVVFDGNDDDVDTTIKVVDQKPSKVFLTLDNTGNRETGNSRIGIGYQNYNLFNLDHRLTAQFITTLHDPDNLFRGVRIFGFGYSIPIYNLGDSVDFLAGYSDVSSGKVQGLFDIAGKGLILGAHYNHNLNKINNYQHKITLGLDHHAFRPDVLVAGINLTPHISSTPISATYSGLWETEAQQLSFSIAGIKNIPVAAHGESADFSQSPYVAEENFLKSTFAVDYTRKLTKEWQLHLAASAQYTSDHLIPGEQFRIGGIDSVRGWHESALAGDKGFRLSAEAISPDFGHVIGEKVGVRGLVFFDKGNIYNNKDTSGAASSTPDLSIASIGAGLRFNYGREFVGRLDYAVAVDGDKYTNSLGTKIGSQEKGDLFMHVGVGYIW